MGKQIYLTNDEISLIRALFSAYDIQGGFAYTDDEPIFESLKNKI